MNKYDFILLSSFMYSVLYKRAESAILWSDGDLCTAVS